MEIFDPPLVARVALILAVLVYFAQLFLLGRFLEQGRSDLWQSLGQPRLAFDFQAIVRLLRLVLFGWTRLTGDQDLFKRILRVWGAFFFLTFCVIYDREYHQLRVDAGREGSATAMKYGDTISSVWGTMNAGTINHGARVAHATTDHAKIRTE